jgi:hypothetical protein
MNLRTTGSALTAMAGLAISLPAAALVTVEAPYLYEQAPFAVARLTLRDAGGTGATCSGSPIAGGGYLLTAAHCLRDTYDNGNWLAQTATVEIFGSQPYSAQVDASQWFWHEKWTGSILDGYDLALIRLPTAAPTSFEIDRFGAGDDGIGTRFPLSVLVAGYGLGGQGAQDPGTYPAGMLRVGSNHYDAFGSVPGSTYLFDFDDDSVAHNALGLPGWSDDGQGGKAYHRVDWNFDGVSAWGEAMIAPGDSGGPSLVEGFIVTGVHSFYSALAEFDSDGQLNSSHGEIGVDTRVAFFAPWIDQHTSPVPELPSALLMLPGTALLLGLRRQRHQRRD